MAFKRLKVKDSTGVVNIALWRDFAESPIEKGSFVTLHNFQTTQTYDQNTKLQKPVLSNRSSKSAVEVSLKIMLPGIAVFSNIIIYNTILIGN